MDSHHDQVKRLRVAGADTPSKLYFAYSTILDRAAFDAWKQEHGYAEFQLPPGKLAEAVDIDLVFDFPSRWWQGRVAGLSDKPGASVFGMLFEIAGGEWPIISHKEGAVTGMSVEREVRVRVDGIEKTAYAFTTNPQRASMDGPLSARFIEALVRGATSAGLPKEYIARLGR